MTSARSLSSVESWYKPVPISRSEGNWGSANTVEMTLSVDSFDPSTARRPGEMTR